jgi:N utilization substance protein B
MAKHLPPADPEPSPFDKELFPARNEKEQLYSEPDSPRRHAREWALQSVYLAGIADTSVDDALDTLADVEDLPQLKKERDLAEALARSALERAESWDETIRPALTNWRLERLALIDRLILRLAVVELNERPQKPYRVILNEYIEIAKDFGSKETARFVNGVLDRLAQDIRPDEVKSGATDSKTSKPDSPETEAEK